MELQELYALIELQPEAVQKLEQIGGDIDLSQIDLYLEQLTDISTAAQSYKELKAFLGEDEGNFKMLFCQLECARRIFDRYQEKHISESIYVDTMKCFTRFIEESNKKNGQMLFDRGWWTYRQTSMNIFRIGTLEYQFGKYEGKNAVILHIPSDADLSKEAVDHSLEQAEIFFQTYDGGYEYDTYTCNSWLLSPALEPLLSEKSNILSFQKRFDIVWEDREDKGYIEWLFQVPVDTQAKELPAVTGLQKKVKELMLNGGTVGCAYGIMGVTANESLMGTGFDLDKLVYYKAVPQDIESLVATRIEVLKAANKLRSDTEMKTVEEESEKYFRSGFESGSFEAYFVKDGDKIVGTGGVSFYQVMPTYHNSTGKKAYIMNMYTHPDYRRRGIACRVLDLLVEEIKKRGITVISLEATEMGRSLYEKYGFTAMPNEMELLI